MFREILENAIKKAGYTNAELAEKSGLSVRTIQYYLKGEREPRLETADILLKALGTEITIGSSKAKGGNYDPRKRKSSENGR